MTAPDENARLLSRIMPRHSGQPRTRLLVNTAQHPTPNAADTPKPLREHVAESVRRYLAEHDNSSDAEQNLYQVALRELEIPLFVHVLEHCDGNQSRAASLLGIHRATLRRKLRDYGVA